MPIPFFAGQSLIGRPYITRDEVTAVARLAAHEKLTLAAYPDLSQESRGLEDAATGVLDAMDAATEAVTNGDGPLSRRIAGERLDDAMEGLNEQIRVREFRLFGAPRARFVEKREELRRTVTDAADFVPPAFVHEQVAEFLAVTEAAGITTGARTKDFEMARELADNERAVLAAMGAAEFDPYTTRNPDGRPDQPRSRYSGADVRTSDERLMEGVERVDPRLALQVTDRQERSLAAAVRHLPRPDGTLKGVPLPQRMRDAADRFRADRDPRRPAGHRPRTAAIDSAVRATTGHGNPDSAASGGVLRPSRAVGLDSPGTTRSAGR